jgi:hypothetical protein
MQDYQPAMLLKASSFFWNEPGARLFLPRLLWRQPERDHHEIQSNFNDRL